MDFTFDILKKYPQDAAAIWWLDNNTSKFIKFTYKDIIESAKKINLLLKQCNVNAELTIGVIGDHHPNILPMILG
jgi:acyl-coenzyme A synthetase/AMP-(fatty) acid ligase